MPVTTDMLSRPIDWKDPVFKEMLNDMQGNILKSHGRDHTFNIFLQLPQDRLESARKAIRHIAADITSAYKQLQEVEDYRKNYTPGGTCIFFFLTAHGYKVLGETPPADPAFLDGMDRRQLGDPASDTWEEHLRPGVDALLIVADDSLDQAGTVAARLRNKIEDSGITILGTDSGHALRGEPTQDEEKGPSIEHFGYVDGRSQPLMLTDDIEKEDGRTEKEMKEPLAPGETLRKWDPAFGPGQVALVRDPNGLGQDSFGSYLIYRKLEQKVKDFKKHEKALAHELRLNNKERGGAMVVGRFENGTPLALSKIDKISGPVPNSFTYDNDPEGLKCPIHAHIRKVNPRHNSDEQRSHLMPRRGIPYGERKSLRDEDFPDGDVGLLFMAYNQDIGRQFEVAQRFWANNFSFPDNIGTGIDPIIGQNSDAEKALWQPRYGVKGKAIPFDFTGFVTMKGGAYFFAPSKSFLENL